MDFCAGLILVCMLFARASCQPVGNKTTDKPLTSAIKELKEKIQPMLDDLSDPELNLNNFSHSQNMTKQLELALEQQPLIRYHISTFRCYTQKFSEVISHLSKELMKCVQLMQDIERWLNGKVDSKNCSLPTFKQPMETLIHVNCFLQLVQKTLTDSNL